MTLAVSKDALCFVKQRENQIVLTIGAYYIILMLSCNKNILLAFHSVSSVLLRDKRRSIKEQNAMKAIQEKHRNQG